MPTGCRSLACAACALAAAAVAGCGRSGGTPDEDLPGVVHARTEAAPAIDAARAARDPAVLTAAIDLPEHRADVALGAHVLTEKSVVEIREAGAVVDDLTTTLTLAYDASGAYHATLDNSADYGREVVFSGDTLYLRPRYARWHRRAPETEGEPTALRDQLASELAAHFDLIAPAVAVADQGEVTQAGRPARKIALDKAAAPRKAPAQHLTQRAWRDTVEVDQVAGEVVLDARSGIPLRAHLEATARFSRDGHAFTMKLTVDHDVRAIGAAPEIATPPPDEVVATPERLHEVDDRDLLLRGLAPPIHRAHGPAAPPPATPHAGSDAGKGSP
jgi:hypothetical protein